MTWLGFTWDGPSTNYPAGSQPWSGNPVAIIPGVAYWTPNQTLPAPALNYAIWALATECQDLYNNVSVAPYNVLEDVYNSGGSFDSYISGLLAATAQTGWNATTYTASDAVQFGALSIATQVGDVIDFEVTFNLMFINGSSNVSQFLLMPTLCYNANSTGYVNIAQGEWLSNQTLLANFYMTQNFTLKGRYTVASGKAGNFLVGVNCAGFAGNPSAEPFTVGLKGTWECKIRHLRAPSY
jgi:hypothetical protein